MSEIVDMLRSSADDMERNPCVAQRFSPKFLRRLACRIDNTMVEWPLGADKKPVKPGQHVYKAINGDLSEYVVHSLRYSVPGWVVLIKRADKDASCIVRPDVLTHERPDSWERIAQELDNLRLTAATYRHLEACDEDAIHDLAKRIRKMAKRED